ncbi:MAG: AAA family ATPase [Paenibacillaceae bacterium]|nr:AAA family ATPase [Paenibacillaceae bacterium]
MLHTGDFLVILKHKEKLLYDCMGIKAENASKGQYQLSSLNNKFYKLPTNTKVDIKKLIEIKDADIERTDFSIQELGGILYEMYSNAEDRMQVASIHIFGIKYGKNIIEKEYRAPDIIKAAGLNESYSTELQKALNIYRCLTKNSYGISISGDGKLEKEQRTAGMRKTGAENILLYGVPGAGKSHEIKTKYCSDEKYMERVVFHPDYMYSDFVGQILPRVEKDKSGNDKLKYVFTPGPFTKMLRKAENDPNNYYYLVIEELNRGNAPAIFGEIFQLLDRKDEEEFPAEEVGESEYGISNYEVAKEVYNDEEHQVRIPSNMFILATMNTADQNVFTLDTAFQRRWNMRQIENRFDKSEHSKDIIAGTKVNWGAFATVINEMVIDINVDMASSEDKRLGTYFAKKKELQVNRFPEKVLKYLWDDAFKMDKTAVFNDNCKSLEEVVVTYEKATNDKLAAVLRLSVYEKMLSKMQQDNAQDTEK